MKHKLKIIKKTQPKKMEDIFEGSTEEFLSPQTKSPSDVGVVNIAIRCRENKPADGATKTSKEIIKLISTKKIGAKNTRSALKELSESKEIDMIKHGRENFYFLTKENDDSNFIDDRSNF